MPAMTPTTLTRIDPDYPLLWRDVNTVQFGLDAEGLRIPLSEPWVEPLLQAMRDGFRRSMFDVIAHGCGAPREGARDLLRLVEPMLIADALAPPRIWLESISLSDSRVAFRIESALREEGFLTTRRAAPGSVGIVIVQGAASAHQLATYLQDDLVHVPVGFEPGGTTVGPLIVPGRTPCLACRDAHERDLDPAWPRLHAQLIGATSTPITTARTVEAAALIARILFDAENATHAKSARITPDGRRVWREARFHAECRCREPSFRSLPESGTDGVRDARPRAPTTSPTSLRRA